MSSFFHLAALCCIPSENQAARRRERQIFREALLERAKYADSNGHENPPIAVRPTPRLID